MTNHELEIIMKLRDEVSQRLEGIQGNLVKFSNSLVKSGNATYALGHQISRAGTLLMTFGALITGPLVLAFKAADKYSGKVHDQLERLQNLTVAFQVQIATALIPVVERVINTLGALWNMWNKINPATQTAIIQGTAIAGVLVTVGGSAVWLYGKFDQLWGILKKGLGSIIGVNALNWQFALIAAAIAAVIIITLKYQSISTPVLNTIEVAAYAVAIGYEKIAKAIAMAIESMGAWSGNTALTQWGADQAQAIDVIIARLESRVSRVFETGKGALETGLEDTKTQVSDLFELLKNPPTFNPDPIVERLASLQEIAHSIWTAMSSDMSTFFFNSIKNKSLKFADFFRDLGNSILKIWTDLLAKMMARWMENMANMESGGATSESKWLTVIKAAVGIFGAIGGGGQGTGIMTEGANAGISAGYDQGILSDGANAGIYAGYGGDSYLSGGVVHALGGLNLGPGEVPVIAHTRERILSREENKDYSQGKQQRGNMVFSQNFNITATDAKSFMSYRKEIVACVKQDILRNTEIRRVIQAYGSRR